MNAQINKNLLFKSRRNGKVHQQWCGSRSRYVTAIKGSDGMTYEEIFEKFGDQLCGTCCRSIKDTFSH